MKWFLIVLGFLNLLFFVYTEIRPDRATESLLAHQNFNSDKIRVLPSAEKSSAASAAMVALARTCAEWGPIGGTDLAAVRRAISPLLLTEQVRENILGNGRYWVFIPPYASEAQAQARVEALKAAGVADSLLIRTDSVLRNGISLGVFNDETAASAQADALKQKGLNDVRILARAKPDAPASFLFVLDDALVRQQLERLRTEYPAIAMKEALCPPAAV